MDAIKTLSGTLRTPYVWDFWSDPTNPLTNRKAYQWGATLTVTPKSHSDANTLTPYVFNGLDMVVGNWIGDSNGRIFKIVSFESQTTTLVELVIQDINFGNAIEDPSKRFSGGPATGSFIYFALSEQGFPNVYGISNDSFPPIALAAINTRFDIQNPATNYITVEQTNNGFVVGDIIKLDEANEGRYELANFANGDIPIGVVNSVKNPGPNSFTFAPYGVYSTTITPTLVGNYGDVFYFDPEHPGKITNVKPAMKAKPVFIRLNSDTEGFILNNTNESSASVNTYELDAVATNQTEFDLPQNTVRVLEMSINGIENKNFTFDAITKKVTFDPVTTGYNVDPEDSVIFTYETFN